LRLLPGLGRGKTAYVTNSALGTVVPIATATNTAGKPIKVGEGSSHAVDPVQCMAITP
jgi:DNA-binding beta-propeller fold protein YncE